MILKKPDNPTNTDSPDVRPANRADRWLPVKIITRITPLFPMRLHFSEQLDKRIITQDSSSAKQQTFTRKY